jgi:hypothetical protein
MKFALLDSRVSHPKPEENKVYTDKYQYLDDLLDKTFITDYFLDHNVSVRTEGSDSPNAASNKYPDRKEK